MKLVWRYRGRVNTVLDPSFGECSFLQAAADYLRDRGLQSTADYVYGVDVDPRARKYLRALN